MIIRSSQILLIAALLLVISKTTQALDVFTDFGLTQELAAPAGYNKIALKEPGPFEFFGMEIKIIERDLQADPKQADNGYAYVDFQLGVTRVPATQLQPVRITIDPNKYSDRYWGNIDIRVLENTQTGQTFFYFLETLIPAPDDEPLMRLLALENNGQVHTEQFYWEERLESDFPAPFFRRLRGVDEFIGYRDQCFEQLRSKTVPRGCQRLDSDVDFIMTDPDTSQQEKQQVIGATWFWDMYESPDPADWRAAIQVMHYGRLPLYWPESIELIEQSLTDTQVESRTYTLTALEFWQFGSGQALPIRLELSLEKILGENNPRLNGQIRRILRFNEQIQK